MKLRKSTGLVGHWKLREGSGTTANDSSRYKNTGTITIGAGKWIDKGYYFDGTATYIDCGSNASLDITKEIAISVWIYATNIGARNEIVNKFRNNQYWLNLQNGYVNVFLGGVTAVYFVSNIVIQTGKWYNILVCYDLNYIYIYINGLYDNSVAKTGNITSGDASVVIGIAGTDFSSDAWNGSINDVRIYNRALPANEVMRLYNSTKHNYI